MKDLIFAAMIVLICIGLLAAVPIFGVIVGTAAAILFISHVIKENKENDQSDKPQ